MGVVLLSVTSIWVWWLLFFATTQPSTHNDFNWVDIIIRAYILVVVPATFCKNSMMIHPQFYITNLDHYSDLLFLTVVS